MHDLAWHNKGGYSIASSPRACGIVTVLSASKQGDENVEAIALVLAKAGSSSLCSGHQAFVQEVRYEIVAK